MVPMSDGVQLHTEVDLPPFHDPTKRITAVLERSPYGANAEELIADIFGEVLGYASIRQDFRGTKQSQGEFMAWHDSASDAYDTIEWITKQSWSNGVIFTTGASADAIDELAQLPSPHPALRGQVVIFAVSIILYSSRNLLILSTISCFYNFATFVIHLNTANISYSFNVSTFIDSDWI